jgi:hypothetical protein
MRKLVLILIAFIAAATFIRAFDKGGANLSASDISAQQGSPAVQASTQVPPVSGQIAPNSVSDL